MNIVTIGAAFLGAAYLFGLIAFIALCHWAPVMHEAAVAANDDLPQRSAQVA
jgi:hypothetical protein